MGYEFDPNDFDYDKGGGGNFLPVGKHIVRVKDHEISETNSGLVQVIVEFERRDGCTRKAWLIAEGKAGFQFGSLCHACGWTSKLDLGSPGMLKRAIYGKDVEIVVEDDTYNGKTQPKVKYINKIEGGTREESRAGRQEERRPQREAAREEPRGGYRGDGAGQRDGRGYGGGGGYGGGYGGGQQDPQPFAPDDDIPF